MYRNPGFKNEELIKALEQATGLSTSVSISHLWDKYLADLGFTDGTLDDRMYALLGDRGFVEDINHRLRVGGMGIGGNLSRDFTNKFLQREFARAINFTRSTKAWGWVKDENGNPVLKEFASGEPRFVIDPATGKELGYLAEASATNELLDNRDLSTGNWGVNLAPTLSQDVAGLDGAENKAWTIVDDDSGGGEYVTQDAVIPDDTQTHAVSVFFKKDSGDENNGFPALQVLLTGGTDRLHAATIDTRNGSNQPASGRDDGTQEVRDAGDWWEVIVSITNNGTGNTTMRVYLWPAISETLGGSVSGSATGSIVYDFGQVELNSSFATSPIETGASAVTRNADDASEPLPSELADGFVWVVHARTAVASESAVLIDVVGATTDEKVRVFRESAGDIRVQVTAAGSNVFNETLNDPGDEVDIKIAFRVESGRFAVVLDGGTPVTSTSTTFPDGLADKYIGLRESSDLQWNSTIALDKMYDNPADWSDADLQEATS